MTYQLTLSATGGTATAALTDTLPDGLTYVPSSVTGGGLYQAGTIRYNGPVTPSSPLIITYQATVNSDLAAGSILQNAAVVTGTGYRLERAAAVAVPNPAATARTLALIYANGDNDLAPYMGELINNAEKAITDTAIVLLLLDGPAVGDSYLYRLQPDDDPSCPNFINPTCNGRYVLGQSMWAWSEDTANPYSLAEFLKGAIRAYPNVEQVVLALVGHGGGWSPDVLAGQPSGLGIKPGQDPLGGLLWDEHPGNALSTPALGRALRWAKQETGQQIGLLYLDACLMAMSEVAYEVRDSVDYLLASENWSWTGFPYDAHLRALDETITPRQIGPAWLANEAAKLRQDEYPFTFSVADLGQLTPLRVAEDALATALIDALAEKSKIEAAFQNSDCFDSNQDGYINPEDHYCDLASFAREIEAQFSHNPSVVIAAQGVQNTVAAVVIAEDHEGGVPWHYSDALWSWGDLGGLSKYLPLINDHWKRRYYQAQYLQMAADGLWDDFLVAY